MHILPPDKVSEMSFDALWEMWSTLELKPKQIKLLFTLILSFAFFQRFSQSVWGHSEPWKPGQIVTPRRCYSTVFSVYLHYWYSRQTKANICSLLRPNGTGQFHWFSFKKKKKNVEKKKCSSCHPSILWTLAFSLLRSTWNKDSSCRYLFLYTYITVIFYWIFSLETWIFSQF